MKTFQRILLIVASVMFLATQAKAIMYWARPYDPNLQRWLTRDPLGEPGFMTLNTGLSRLQNNLEILKANPSLQNLSLKLQTERKINALMRPAEIDQGPNLYVFVHNNSISFVDPTGLKLTACDCQNFLNDMLKQAAAASAEEGHIVTLQELLAVVAGGAAGAATENPAVFVWVSGGVGSAGGIYSIGNYMQQKIETAQNVNRLYNLCMQQAASGSTK